MYICLKKKQNNAIVHLDYIECKCNVYMCWETPPNLSKCSFHCSGLEPDLWGMQIHEELDFLSKGKMFPVSMNPQSWLTEQHAETLTEALPSVKFNLKWAHRSEYKDQNLWFKQEND